MSRFAAGVVTALLQLSLVASSHAAAIAGRVLYASGPAAVEREGPTVALSKGSFIFEGDRIRTGADSRLQLLMVDGAHLAIRPDTIFIIEQYELPGSTADPVAIASNDGKAVMRLAKGAFRAISGRIGKSYNPATYQVVAPVATLGIRGTDYNVRFCKGDCGSGDGLEPPPKNGLYVGVNAGSVWASNAEDTVDIDINQYAFVAAANAAPTLLMRPPSVLSSSSYKRDEGDEEEQGDENEDSSLDESAEETPVNEEQSDVSRDADNDSETDGNATDSAPDQQQTTPPVLAAREDSSQYQEQVRPPYQQISDDNDPTTDDTQKPELTVAARNDNLDAEFDLEDGSIADDLEEFAARSPAPDTDRNDGSDDQRDDPSDDADEDAGDVDNGGDTGGSGDAPNDERDDDPTDGNAGGDNDQGGGDAAGDDDDLSNGNNGGNGNSGGNPNDDRDDDPNDGNAGGGNDQNTDDDNDGNGNNGNGGNPNDDRDDDPNDGNAGGGNDQNTDDDNDGNGNNGNGGNPNDDRDDDPNDGNAGGGNDRNPDGNGNNGNGGNNSNGNGNAGATALSTATQLTLTVSAQGAGIGTNIPDARIVEGQDPDTGLNWGRWEAAYGDNANAQPGHYVMDPVTDRDVALPIKGVLNYALSGGTQPTDVEGETGTLNSGQLTADFTNQTVVNELNISIGGDTWQASGKGSISSGAPTFDGSYSVTRESGSAGQGNFSGFFGGSPIPTGVYQGAPSGAGIGYSLESDGSTVTGTAAFKAISP